MCNIPLFLCVYVCLSHLIFGIFVVQADDKTHEKTLTSFYSDSQESCPGIPRQISMSPIPNLQTHMYILYSTSCFIFPP